MKNNQYKLLINNQQKKIIKEAEYSLEDTTKFIDDLFTTGTNLIKATVISLGAHWEHAVFATEVVGFASIENINKKFLEKITEAEKLYDAAVPDAVKGDVNFLFNINNPAIFVGKKIVDTVTDAKTIELYVPFSWAIKYIFSGDFFKNDVKDFGQIFGGMPGLKVNNIIWYWGWLFRKVILNNIEDLKNAIDNQLLTKTGIEQFKNIKNMRDLTDKYPQVVMFLRGTKAFETLTKPVTEFYDFCKRWQGNKFLRIATLQHYILKESGNNIKFNYNDTFNRIAEQEEQLKKETNPQQKQIIQQEIQKLKNRVTEIENIQEQDSNGTNFNIKDIVEADKENEEDDIKVIGDAATPQKTAIDAQIEEAKIEISTAATNANKKLAQDKLKSLEERKKHLQKKHGKKYADVTDKTLIDKAKKAGKNATDLIKERKKLAEERLKTLGDAIDKDTSPNSLRQKLKDEQRQLYNEFMDDFKRTSSRVFKSEFELLPDLANLFLGDELGKQFENEMTQELQNVYDMMAGLIDVKKGKKQLQDFIRQTIGLPSLGTTCTLDPIVNAPPNITLTWSFDDGSTPNIVIEYDTANTFVTAKTINVNGALTHTFAAPPPGQYFIRINFNGTEYSNVQTVTIAAAVMAQPQFNIKVPNDRQVDVTITNDAALKGVDPNIEYECVISYQDAGGTRIVQRAAASPNAIQNIPVEAANPNIPSGNNVKVVVKVINNATGHTLSKNSNTVVAPGRPLFEYILKIQDDKKVLIENAVRAMDPFEVQIKQLDRMGLQVSEPNKAEEIVLKNLLSNKKINDKTRQWLEASRIIKETNGNLPDPKAKKIFYNMLDISTKFFTNLQFDIMKGVEEINDVNSEQAQQINKELKKEFGYDLVPKNMAEQALFNFNLLCEIYRLYSVSYLTNIKIIFKENEVLINLLKNQKLDEVTDLLNSLKNEASGEIQTILSDDVSKKFETTNRQLLKYFGNKQTQSYADFKHQQDGLFKMIKETKVNLDDFCEKTEKAIANFKKLPEPKKLAALDESIREYLDNNEKNVQIVYEKFLPGLQNLQKKFLALSQTKDKLMKNYEKLLVMMNDQKNFNTIYTENYKKFNAAYSECIKYTGLTQTDGKLQKDIAEIKDLQKQYQDKIKTGNIKVEEPASKKKKDQATLNIQTNTPIKITNSDE